MEMLISRGNFPQFFSDEQKTAFQIPTAVQEMFNKYTNIARVLSYASLRTRIKVLKAEIPIASWLRQTQPSVFL